MAVAIATAAPQSRPAIVWMQAAVVPPGTNGTTRPAVTPGPGATAAPQGGAMIPAALPMGGIVGGSIVPPDASSPVRTPAVRGAAVGVPGNGTAGTPAPAPSAIPAAPPGTPVPPACQANLATERASIPYKGGIAEMRVTFFPPNCSTLPVISSNWVHAEPAASEGVYRFTIAPNPTNAIRQVTLSFGNRSFVIAQAAGHGYGIAASPGRLEFDLKPNKSKKLPFLIWSDDAEASFTVAPLKAVKWLQVTRVTAKKPAKGKERYEVKVDTKGLPPGRQDALIRVVDPGATNSPFDIPVVLSVAPK